MAVVGAKMGLVSSRGADSDMDQMLSNQDFRALFELQGELCEIAEGSPDEAVDHLMSEVPALLEGNPAIWWTVTNQSSTVLLVTRIAGLDSAALRRWEQGYLLEGVYADNPIWPHTRGESVVQTLRRRDVLTDQQWYGSPHIAEYCRGLGYDDCIVSRRLVGNVAPGAPPIQGVLAVCRPWGERAFSLRDAALVDAIQRKLGWLHRKATLVGETRRREAIRDAMQPRFRRVLDQLLRGPSEKEIAYALGLSERTVHKYVEQIYEAYSVRSRAELMAVWIDAGPVSLAESEPVS